MVNGLSNPLYLTYIYLITFIDKRMKNLGVEDLTSLQTSLVTQSMHPSQLKLLERISETSNEESQVKSIEYASSHDLLVIAEDAPVQDLRVGGIVNEILNLILRLEYQRRRADAMLMNERIILDKLKSDIEGLALRKARELPSKVQAEHDACVADITELNWHISFNQKTERKLARRCDQADKLFFQLKERIGNMKETMPQIEEKCRYEKDLCKRINKAQRDIDELLAKNRDRLRDTEDKLAAANQKAVKEREAYEADLNATRWELSKAKLVKFLNNFY